MGIKTRTSQSQPSQPSSINAGSGWEQAPTELTRRVVFMDIVGPTDSGRTSLALTAPGPIALAHTAEKVDGIVQKAVRLGRDVKLLNFGGVFKGEPQSIANQAAPLWNRMKNAWYGAIDGWAKTVIMDTASEGWEMIRLARFGELNPKGRVENLYGPVNAEWRSMFKHFRQQTKCNVVTIHQQKDEYIDKMVGGRPQSMRTGKQLRAGMKEMAYLPDVIVETGRDPVTGEFTATVRKGWAWAESEGLVVEGADIRFSYIMHLITGLDESEWE